MTAVLQTQPRAIAATVPARDDSQHIVFYEGDRVYLRPIELSDEPVLRRWINDPNIWRDLAVYRPMNGVREREWIERLGTSADEIVLGIVERSADVFIGVAGLRAIHPVNRTARFGIQIGERAFHGRGFGTEATALVVRYGFEELNLNRIELGVFEDNPRAIFVYQRVGFVHEGISRQAYFGNGKYRDVHRFAILREDWERSRQGTGL